MSWTLKALLGAAGVRYEATGDVAVAGLAHDSRAVEPGDLFCCIRGAVADGHDFAPQAVASGAAALLVERPVGAGLPEARVGRVRAAVGPVADTFFDRPSDGLKVCGVTGTNGKTTVTYLLEAIVAEAGRRPGVIGTVSYRVDGTDEPALRTTPEAIDLQRLLARMRGAGTDVAVMEVASHALEQDRVKATRFYCGAFTNLTQDHLDYHADMESYFEAKARLFAMTDRAAINVSDLYGRRLADRGGPGTIVTFGGPHADVRAESVRFSRDGTDAVVNTSLGPLEIRTSLVGPYNLDNVLCATAMALFLDVGAEAIVRGIGQVHVVPGRLEVVLDAPFTVLVDYAHTPDALARALGASRMLGEGKVIVVFGCGGDRDPSKRPQMGEAATSAADLVIVTSDNPRSEDPMAIIDDVVAGAERGGGAHRIVPDRREAIAAALVAAAPGDVVLVAGKGHEQGQTFKDRTLPFDDREVVRELVAEWGCRA